MAESLKGSIQSILKQSNRALALGEILESLSEIADTSASAVRQALNELEADKKIIAFPDATLGPGRPKYLYRLLEAEAILESPITRNKVEAAAEKRETQQLLRQLIQDATGRYSLLPLEEVDRIYREAASRFTNESPVDLFYRFGVWLKDRHDSYLDKMRKSKNKGDRKLEEESRSVLQRIETYARKIFNEMIGVPAHLRDDHGNSLGPGPYRVSHDENTLASSSNIESVQFRKYLKLAVLGKSVLERVRLVDVQLPLHIGGSDASIQPLSLAMVLPWHMEPGVLNIVTAIGVRYDIFNGVQAMNRYPEPKVLAQYERQQAIEEGLLIPPAGTLGFDEEFEGRVKEAAMNLRQYIKDHDLMFESEPSVKIHFRDGRIFPLEHRLFDAIQPGLHGEIVRSALKIFRNIANAVGAEQGKTLYCGFVKRAGITIMAPLFHWFVGFGSQDSGQVIDGGMTVEEFLKSPDSDNVVVNRLFAALVTNEKGEGAYVTFRILRRFQSMEESPVQGFSYSTDPELWTKRLEGIATNLLAADPRRSGVEIVASLCARAAVLQFYASLSKHLDPKYEQSVFVPRIECLVPYPDLVFNSDSRPVDRLETDYVKRLLSVMFYPGVLENYPDEVAMYTTHSPKVFLVPRPVVESHVAAKAIAQLYRDDFLELLAKEARIYWLTARREGKSIST